MCVVLFAELTPIFLDLLERSDITDSTRQSQSQSLAILALCRSMLMRLVLSLYHPEAPFNVHNGPPECLQFSAEARMFECCRASLNNDSPSTDPLSLLGGFIAFRVKQDHIGAVCLQKTVAAMLAHAIQRAHIGTALVEAIFPHSSYSGGGLLATLPDTVRLLKEAQYRGQQGGTCAALTYLRRELLPTNTKSINNDSKAVSSQQQQEMLFDGGNCLFGLCLFHLSSLQQLSRYV
jgi:hypothetical protein